MSKKDPYKDLESQYKDLYIEQGYDTITGDENNALIRQTINKGKPLTKDEVLDLIGRGVFLQNEDKHYRYYIKLLDNNPEFFGFDSSGKPYVPEEGGPQTTTTNLNSGLDEYKKLIQDSLMTSPTSTQAQQYRDAMYNSINQYEQATMATMASSEMEAYRALGQQQMQLENQIAEQRMHAIKSGVTSAQLASQELANIFAAQTGASQIASQVMQNRAGAAETFAKQRAAVESDLYGMLVANQQTAANAYTQLGAAQASYNSYAQQPYNQFQAAIEAYEKKGGGIYSTLLGYNNN